MDADPDVTEFLHREIPITRAMGVKVVSGSPGPLIVEAPLALNHNHLGTAFGGSLSTIATVAGYAFVWLELRDRSAHVVIRDSTIKFRRPVRADLRATCHPPKADILSAFRSEFARKDKARLQLRVEIKDDDALAVEFVGIFVAIKGAAR